MILFYFICYLPNCTAVECWFNCFQGVTDIAIFILIISFQYYYYYLLFSHYLNCYYYLHLFLQVGGWCCWRQLGLGETILLLIVIIILLFIYFMLMAGSLAMLTFNHSCNNSLFSLNISLPIIWHTLHYFITALWAVAVIAICFGIHFYSYPVNSL